MCGFAGFLTAARGAPDDLVRARLARMADAVASRGPDSAGYWHDASSGIALAHRRLAIVDLSPAGAQPMESACGRYVLVFNGEIYNHLDLRRQLDGYPWRGHSDTETLLAGVSAWGLRATLERSIGMFALALWDRQRRALALARDRMGEKPLYYGWQGQGDEACLLFGSDLAALRAHPTFAAGINRDALALYMRHNAIAAPHSIYEGIHKLSPGCLLTTSLEARTPKVERYWSLPQVAEQGVASPFSGTDTDAVEALESLLVDAVGRQMMADVPLGAFLSGGIDSSAVVALMQSQSARPIKTFTIGFEENGFDEAVHAKAVARHLGTEHTEMYLTAREAMSVIPKLPSLYSEPFSDSSQIPTFLVSQLARQHVKVSLSGDAGDELFAGYSRYQLARKIWDRLDRAPAIVRNMAASSVRALPSNAWNALAMPFRPVLPGKWREANLGDKMHKGAALLSADSLDALYLKLVTHWEPADVVIGANEPATSLRGNPLPLAGLDSIQRMMALDAITYLPDDILVKVDRAAMGVSLETRVPFLDHRVVEFAWRLPQHMKLRDGAGKWLLRQVLHRHVPRTLLERPKMGFGVPIDSWLRGPLRDWAEALLDEATLRREGLLDPAPIRKRWREHLSGKRNWQHHLWDVLMFQAWLDANKQG